MQSTAVRWAAYSTSKLLYQWRVSSPRKGHRIRDLPRHILLLRHGQSLGNVDQNLFATMPDWKIPLSDTGKAQAREAGRRIQHLIRADSPLILYVSPYVRTKETLLEVQSVLKNPVLFTREEPRLREQDFGNFQDPKLIQLAKQERPQFGRFFYRFPDGESGADVFDRVSAFGGTFRQDMQQIANSRDHEESKSEVEDATALFVTHGITARLFLMRWLHWSVDEFEVLHNPPNCGLLHLQRTPDGSSYELAKESRELIKAPGVSGGGLQLGEFLEERRRKLTSRDRAAIAALADTAWGI
jgi:broad specificity phosphatase PhoE